VTDPDLRPLLDETEDPVEQALLREAREVRASDDTKRATLAALGLVGSGAPPPAKPGLGLGAKLVLVTGGLLVAGVVVWLASGAPPSAGKGAAAEGSALATTPAPALAPPSASASVVPPPPAPSAVASADPTPLVVSVPAPRPSVRPPPAASATFADEVRLIDQARKALYDRDKEGALRALDEYDRRFPPSHPGQMAADAAALRVRARAL
jgi:hypothetical protein